MSFAFSLRLTSRSLALVTAICIISLPSVLSSPCPDLPDDYGHDENGDGIDGTIACAWFVAPSGTNGIRTKGNINQPFASLSYAINTAAPGDHIYCAAGSYEESGTLNISKPLVIAGGYTVLWSRPPYSLRLQANVTVRVRAAVAVNVTSTGTAAVQLFSMQFSAVNSSSSAPGQSSVALAVHRSTVVSRDCTLVASGGSDGALGANGDVGTKGGNSNNSDAGYMFANCTSICNLCPKNYRGTPQGSSGAPGCDGTAASKGGSGGAGGYLANGGRAAFSPLDPGAGVAGGGGASGGVAPLSASGSRADGNAGDPGGPGQDSVAVGVKGVAVYGDTYQPGAGSAGGDGTAGAGGGGGSGGSGGSCLIDCCSFGGGGVGGSGGGCGGRGGGGGGGGGGSFPVYVVDSTASFVRGTFLAAPGGAGGPPGQGGPGGSGGDVGSPRRSLYTAGGGGGSGGTGGAGADGGSGAVGDSNCVVTVGSTATTTLCDAHCSVPLGSQDTMTAKGGTITTDPSCLTATPPPIFVPTRTGSTTRTPSPLIVPTRTRSITPTVSPSETDTRSRSATRTPSSLSTDTNSASASPSRVITATPTAPRTPSPSYTVPSTITTTPRAPSPSYTVPSTITPPRTITPTPLIVPTRTRSITPTVSPSETDTRSRSATRTPSSLSTDTNSASASPSRVITATPTAPRTPSPSYTVPSTITPPRTITPTPVPTSTRTATAIAVIPSLTVTAEFDITKLLLLVNISRSCEALHSSVDPATLIAGSNLCCGRHAGAPVMGTPGGVLMAPTISVVRICAVNRQVVIRSCVQQPSLTIIVNEALLQAGSVTFVFPVEQMPSMSLTALTATTTGGSSPSPSKKNALTPLCGGLQGSPVRLTPSNASISEYRPIMPRGARAVIQAFTHFSIFTDTELDDVSAGASLDVLSTQLQIILAVNDRDGLTAEPIQSSQVASGLAAISGAGGTVAFLSSKCLYGNVSPPSLFGGRFWLALGGFIRPTRLAALGDLVSTISLICACAFLVETFIMRLHRSFPKNFVLSILVEYASSPNLLFAVTAAFLPVTLAQCLVCFVSQHDSREPMWTYGDVVGNASRSADKITVSAGVADAELTIAPQDLVSFAELSPALHAFVAVIFLICLFLFAVTLIVVVLHVWRGLALRSFTVLIPLSSLHCGTSGRPLPWYKKLLIPESRYFPRTPGSHTLWRLRTWFYIFVYQSRYYPLAAMFFDVIIGILSSLLGSCEVLMPLLAVFFVVHFLVLLVFVRMTNFGERMGRFAVVGANVVAACYAASWSIATGYSGEEASTEKVAAIYPSVPAPAVPTIDDARAVIALMGLIVSFSAIFERILFVVARIRGHLFCYEHRQKLAAAVVAARNIPASAPQKFERDAGTRALITTIPTQSSEQAVKRLPLGSIFDAERPEGPLTTNLDISDSSSVRELGKHEDEDEESDVAISDHESEIVFLPLDRKRITNFPSSRLRNEFGTLNSSASAAGSQTVPSPTNLSAVVPPVSNFSDDNFERLSIPMRFLQPRVVK